MERYLLEKDEYFYGGAINDGIHMPFNINSEYSIDLNVWHSGNQATSLLFSSKGTIFYSKYPFKFEFKSGVLTIEGKEIQKIKTKDTLRDAHDYICKNIFKKCNEVPDLVLFKEPQFNTWIEMEWNCTQEKVLKYAKRIIKEGYKPGVLMIDDCWCHDYGVWDFDNKKFPNPKKMMKTLHELGFKVMLWICPFVSLDSAVFRKNLDNDIFVKNSKNEIYISHWWNGYSAVLDLTNEAARSWIKSQLNFLMTEYGVDGFKLDACDPEYYIGDVVFKNSNEVSSQAKIWCEIGEEYRLSELRVGFNNGISSIAHRLRDKNHSWDNDGLNTLIPNAIALSMLGYPFLCPDMIGGGMVPDFHREGFEFDEELFIRYAQVSSLFPMIQFSLAPWRCLSKENQKICLRTVEVHNKYLPEIINKINEAKKGIPIIRSVAFNENDSKYSLINDQFFLGDDLLVCPQVKKEKKRRIILPKGDWVDELGNIYNEGEHIIDTPLDRLPIFRRGK